MLRVRLNYKLAGKIWGLVATLAVSLFLKACSGYDSSGSGITVYEYDCSLPTDQNKTLTGRWTVQPIQISFYQVSPNYFDADEKADIIAAADTWNSFMMKTQGFKIFDYGTEEEPRISTTARPADACTAPIVSNGAFTSSVVIYKQNPWPYPKPSSSTAAPTIAITATCPVAASPIAEIQAALIELNYEDYFVSGKKLPDLQSILLHEFGHLLGINHSCESGSTTAGIPDCVSSTIPLLYKTASMFPEFTFDAATKIGEERRTLNTNDQGRANCLYQDFKQ